MQEMMVTLAEQSEGRGDVNDLQAGGLGIPSTPTPYRSQHWELQKELQR